MKLFQRPIPVLMYHQIDLPKRDSSLSISPESFRRQIEWLERKSFRFFSLDEVVDRNNQTPLWGRSVALTFDDGFRNNYQNAFSLLIQKRKPAALFVVVDWVGRDGFLGWKEIRELADRGITIGSHSLSHRWLPDVLRDEELEREVVDSKKRIEDQIAGEVRHFSYPVGGIDERVAECVRKAGYRAAWVAGARPSYQSASPSLCLRRIKVGPRDVSLAHFSIKAYGIKSLFQ